MAENKEYFVRVCGTSVPVTQEVYQTCHQTKRYAKTLYEKDERHNLLSYDGMDTEEMLGEETIPDLDAPSVEDAAIANILRDKLRRSLSLLPESDRQLIYAIYFDGLSERKLSAKTGVHYMTIHSRKAAILRTLKKLMQG